MKAIHFEPAARAQIRAIDQRNAMDVLETIHRYAEAGAGDVKALSGEFDGFLRLRAGNYRIFFEETADLITVHRVRDRREAYR